MILRLIVERRLDFSEGYGGEFGAVIETLECGHRRVEAITGRDAHPLPGQAREEAEYDVERGPNPVSPHAKRRRCWQCERLARSSR